MAILKILTYPEPVLRQRSKPVGRWDEELYKLIEDMTDTLEAVPGLGLAAVQVGVPVRLFIYDEGPGDGKSERSYSVLVNPEVVSQEGEIREEEGCLSILEYRDIVIRSAVVKVTGFNKKGDPAEIAAEGLLARVFQHEIDHLNGVLFIDRLSSLKRGLFLRRVKKLQKQSKAELSGKL